MFISNNYPSFHLWWKENLVKHRKVSKYETDCRQIYVIFYINDVAKRHQIQEFRFSDIFKKIHVQNIAAVPEKMTKKIFFKSGIHHHTICFISNFTPIGLKFMTPSQIKKNVFPPKRKMVKSFWVFRTLSSLALSKNWIVILLVQVPCSFYWTILYSLYRSKQLTKNICKSLIDII